MRVKRNGQSFQAYEGDKYLGSISVADLCRVVVEREKGRHNTGQGTKNAVLEVEEKTVAGTN